MAQYCQSDFDFASAKELPLSSGAPTITQDGYSFQFIVTRDGSPSIRMWNVSDCAQEMKSPEAMHHCDGALSESLYIYGSLLEEPFLRDRELKILSVGLGCGYNEWIALAKIKNTRSNVYVESFESNSFLRKNFTNWLIKNDDSSVAGLFSDVVARVAEHFKMREQELKDLGRELYNNNRWQIRERLDSTAQFQQKFNVIFFDAFSTKATPELWNDEFLDWLLASAADDPCGFATYAATGRLNRALNRAHFKLVPFRGFSGKRESTRAYR